MANNSVSIDGLVNKLLGSEELDGAVKEAQEESKTDSSDSPDLEELATKVAEKLQGGTHNPSGSDKVDALVDEFNKEASDLASSQETIVTELFNNYCTDGRTYDSGQVVKMAADEDSVIPYLIDNLYKYAAAADSMLAEKYDNDYQEGDVVKMAGVLIESTPDPFGMETLAEEAEAEKQAQDQTDPDLADQFVDEIMARLDQRLSNQ